jgi:very-short-patch-repair endonuclease
MRASLARKPKGGRIVRSKAVPVPAKPILRVNRRSEAQVLMGLHLRELGFTGIEYEYLFCSGRKWRADLAVPSSRLLIECDGHYQGHHGTGWGSDNEKNNTAQCLGWKILRFHNQEILSGRAKDFISKWMR